MSGSSPRRPRYVEIADRLRRRINSGELEPGARIPTERDLMDSYGVSVTVARAAIADLRGEGLVYSQQGKGSFVAERRELFRFAANRYRRTGLAPNRREADRGGWVDEVTAERRAVQATDDVALRLGVEPGAPVSEVAYNWFADGELVQVSTQWEPLSITGGTPIEVPVDGGNPGNPDVVTRFDSIGITITHVDEYIRARMPTPDEARTLAMPIGVPVFTIIRTHYADELAVETATITIRADRMVLCNTQEVPA